jgi:hypothetical protein
VIDTNAFRSRHYQTLKVTVTNRTESSQKRT